MDEHERGGLLGLAVGTGLGAWAYFGGGGVGMGVIAVLLIVGSIAWLGADVL